MTGRGCGTPNGSAPSSSVINSMSPRRSCTRQSIAASRGARTNASTALKLVTMRHSSSIHSLVIGPMDRHRSITARSSLPAHHPESGHTVLKPSGSKRPPKRQAMPPDPAAGAATREIVIEVLRYRSETDLKPLLQAFRVPFTDDMSVLQGLQYIKDHLDGSLTFRWSCRMAVCGSCGMQINGVPKLACETFLRDFMPDGVRVEPLTHFPIVRDLVIDQSDFLAKLDSVRPYLI